jgi:glucose-6-phosphate-specific signal transduction histidine kinase
MVIAVVDDGVGGADGEGKGLRGLTDRVEALGGRLTLDSPAGGGTRLRAEIPFGPPPPASAAGGEPTVLGETIDRFVI